MALLGKIFWAGWARPAWKTLQCPGWPLCGVVILAVCFLASQAWGALSLSSRPKEILGGNRLFCVEWFMLSLHLLSNHGVVQWVVLDSRASTHTISSDPHK